MAKPKFVVIPQQPVERFESLMGDRYAPIAAAVAPAREAFEGRAIWHVSSTRRGGGVAEMLWALLPYVRGVGIDTRWVVLRESIEFFEVTKRVHNLMHGDPGDGGDLGEVERELYERTLATSARHLTPLLQPGDIVFLHDPQTAGLADAVREAGATVVWRCHIGIDVPNGHAHRAWDFLLPYVSKADAYVFSRQAYVWDVLDASRARVMAPCIDPFAPKNSEIDRDVVDEIVAAIGLAPATGAPAPLFTRADGTPGRVERAAEVIQDEPLDPAAPAVTQISRWDRLKDHAGLLRCFERHLPRSDARLVLAGPATSAVSDDPEDTAVWGELVNQRESMPEEVRRRTHLVSLPMDDIDENATMVNALQRRAQVVVQKSIAEGFGLTVAEAMWKWRPVIGSRVGGIQDQIVDGVSGVLLDDPRDLDGLAKAIVELSGDPARAAEIGERARERVAERFLASTRLAEYAALLEELLAVRPG